jgi:hypothetical protein
MKSHNKLSVLLVLSCLSFPALAGNDNANPCGNNGNNCNPTGTTTNNPVANGGTGIGIAGAAASASAAATAGVKSDIRNTNNVLNTTVVAPTQTVETATNVKNTNDTEVVVQGDNFEARRNPVATAFAVAPMPSATCRSGAALGIQAMGFGVTGGGDKAVDSCEINEATRIAHSIGEKDMAVEIFCMGSWAAKTSQCQAVVGAFKE